jgi:hypothetical protein
MRQPLEGARIAGAVGRGAARWRRAAASDRSDAAAGVSSVLAGAFNTAPA